MRLFDQFVIREQEVFACRVVNYLLQRSPEIRAGLIEAINHQVPDLWLINDHHFSCTPERSTGTPSPEISTGRVDVFIEIDNAVIAIEAKLSAALGADQPAKYLQTLSRATEQLAMLRGRDVASVFVLLMPEGRRGEAEAALASGVKIAGIRSAVLTWEDLFQAWREAKITDGVTLFILDELEHLVLTQIGRRKDFHRLVPALRIPLAQAAHDAHAEFVGWLYPAFRGERPDLATRLHAGRNRSQRTYLGRYFALGQVDGCWGWYGFVDPAHAGDPAAREPVFVMGIDVEVPDLGDTFERITFSHPGFNENATWWRIRFDKTWDQLTRWQKALQPVREAIASASRAS